MNNVELVKKAFGAIEANDHETLKSLLSDDFKFSGPVPEPLDGPSWITLHKSLGQAFPDWAFNFTTHTEDGDVVAFTYSITATHNGDLDVPGFGIPSVTATGKSVKLPTDEVRVTCHDGKITKVETTPAPDKGISGILAQLGIKLPN